MRLITTTFRWGMVLPGRVNAGSTTEIDQEENVVSFPEDEIAYLRSQRLARLATVGQDGQPDVVPVSFEFDGEYFYVGGRDPVNTRKFRNVRDGNSEVAIVIDDVASTDACPHGSSESTAPASSSSAKAISAPAGT
jgi:hypothetical protein